MKLPGTVPLDGIGARFKGGRTYVHGSDLIGFLDGWAAQEIHGHLSKIEFRHPLETQGVLFISPAHDEWQGKAASALGALQGEEALLDFAIFPTDIPIVASAGFPEQVLMEHTGLDEKGSALLHYQSGASATEHVTSAMKALCQSILPQHDKWWFARCKLAKNIPNTFETLELVFKRVMAKTLVTAEIRFDAESSGELTFIGAAQ